jgi:hypothetical protein
VPEPGDEAGRALHVVLQHLGSRLLVVPSSLDRCHLRGLVVNNVFTVEVPEDKLDRNQLRREFAAEARVMLRMGLYLAAVRFR